MPIIRREQLKAGMILVKDVRDRSGRTLLSAGAEIAEKHIRTLQSWGVAELDVRGEADAPPRSCPSVDEIDPQGMERAREEAQRLFCKADLQMPLMQELFNIVVHRLAVSASRRT
jgi:hypothetical protein